jgi:hypothetical protein
MTQSEKQAWEQVRSQGRTRYLVREGLLKIGVRAWVVLALLQLVVRVIDRVFDTVGHEWPLWLDGAWITLCAVVFGAFVGRSHWRRKEAEYEEPTKNGDVA